MKTITTILIIFISASLSAQVNDSITSDWVNVGYRSIQDYEPFKQSAWIELKNVTDIDYDSIKVQYRINLEGVVQQRQRFYYTK